MSFKSKNKKSYFFQISIILLIATILRLILLNKPFCANDVALFQQFTLDSVPLNGINSFFEIGNYGIGNPLRVFAFLYSITYPIYWLGMVGVYSLVGISFTDFSWRIPILLVGVLSILIIYLFLKKFLNKKQSLITAAFFVIFPLHVAWSRSTANTMLFSLSFQLLAIYYFINYFETHHKNSLFLSSIFIALFILSDNFFPQFLVLMAFVFVVYNRRILLSYKHLKKSILQLFNWRMFLFPFLALLLQVSIFMVIYTLNTPEVGFNAGMLGHILAKPKHLGVHLFSIIGIFWEVLNPILFGFIVIFGLWGVKSFFRLEKKSILLFAGMIYLLPFVFFMNPSTVNVKIYLFTSIVFLILFAFVNFFDLKLKKSIIFIIIGLLFLATFLSLFPKVYGIPEGDDNFITYGSNLQDCGVKGVGYWIRENTPEDFKIMSKYSSTRIGCPNGKYYLHRRIYAVFSPPTWNKFFVKHLGEVDAILLTPRDQYEIKTALDNGFTLAYDLIYNDKEFLLFLKGKHDLQKLDLSIYSHLYDQKFNQLKDYLRSPNYVADSPAWV